MLQLEESVNILSTFTQKIYVRTCSIKKMTVLVKNFWNLGLQITGKCIFNTLSDSYWVKVSR